MAYEVFTRTVRRSKTPSITFTMSGRVAFSKAAYEVLHKQAAEWALLLWDPATRKVAIKPSKKDPRAYELHSHEKGGGGFSAVSFFEHIGLEYKKGSRQYVADWNNELGMFEVSLAEDTENKTLLAVMEGGSRRTRR